MAATHSPFLMRRQPGERAVWNCPPAPGAIHVSLNVSRAEFDFVAGRGWATIDGDRWSYVPNASDRDSGFLRLSRHTAGAAA